MGTELISVQGYMLQLLNTLHTIATLPPADYSLYTKCCQKTVNVVLQRQ